MMNNHPLKLIIAASLIALLTAGCSKPASTFTAVATKTGVIVNNTRQTSTPPANTTTKQPNKVDKEYVQFSDPTLQTAYNVCLSMEDWALRNHCKELVVNKLLMDAPSHPQAPTNGV